MREVDLWYSEYYTEEHYRSLRKYEARHLDRPVRLDRCVDVHGPNCNSGCRSCHSCRYAEGPEKPGTSLSSQMRWLQSCSKNFLIVSVIRRQKTVEKKTECGCGRGTGFWCGSCLSTRMGQNIQEVFRMPDWRCPSCLQICNCSGRTCDRHLAGLGCTRILSGEARDQGYMSVSFPTILSHLQQHKYSRCLLPSNKAPSLRSAKRTNWKPAAFT